MRSQQAARGWSDVLPVLYAVNPLASIIDNLQNLMVRGRPSDFSVIGPGVESYVADVS